MTLSNSKHANNEGINKGFIVADNSGTININTCVASKRIPSLISNIIKVLGSSWTADIGMNSRADSLHAYKPEEKIKYNCIIKYREQINEFAAYYSFCEDYLNKYDDISINSKSKILKNISMLYSEIKGDLLLQYKKSNLSDHEIIQENADDIIDKMKYKIYSLVENDIDVNENITHEEIYVGITCFVCYCFIECKILERPK